MTKHKFTASSGTQNNPTPMAGNMKEALRRIQKNKRTKSEILDLSGLGLTELPDELWDCVWVEELSLGRRYWDDGVWKIRDGLRGKSILKIPTQIQKLKNLTTLILDWTKIDDLKIIYKLTSLTCLDLSYTQVKNLKGINSLVSLERLYLNGIALGNSDFFLNLPNLMYLNVSNAFIEYLNRLIDLPNLQTIDLSETRITSLKELNRFANLKNLYLRRTDIVDLCDVYKLKNVENIDLCGSRIKNLNGLNRFPNLRNLNLRNTTRLRSLYGLSGLSNLQSLNLNTTLIRTLAGLDNLPSLRYLDLSNSRVIDTRDLGNLPNLVKLEMDKSRVEDLRGLHDLPSLKFLYLNETKITSLKGLKNLPCLHTLELNCSELTNVSELKGLTSLRHLELMCPTISEVNWLSSLSNLEFLDLTGTSITQLVNLHKLSNLVHLNLKHTKITNISELSVLSNLQSLNLQRTKVSDFKILKTLTKLINLELGETEISDANDLSSLTNLISIDISRTKIRDISVFKNFSLLEALDLSNTPLTYLPHEIIFLSNISYLNLHDTNINNIPQELSNSYFNVLPDLKHYFSDIQKGYYLSYEAKQIIVGNGRVGKTSILKTLYGLGPYNSREDSTHGVQLHSTTLTLPEKQANVSLSIWDFGGQELYHATHRIFMQTRALYLVVWDPITEAKPGEETVNLHGQDYIFRNYPLSYWLGNVRALSKDAKIIVICNKADDGQERFPDNLKEVQAEYNIDSFISVSAKTGYGIPILRQRIQYLLDQMPEMGMQMPGSWRRVREKLTKIRMKKQYISLKKYHAVCTAEALSVGSMDTLLHFLHLSGFLFWHKAFLRHEIILDQKWALEAIYQLLDRNGWYALLKGNALRQRSELAKCWSAYDAEQINLFLEMMQSCELALKLEDKQSNNPHYLIPEFLPDTPAPAVADIWQATTGPIYYFRFQHPFFHAALIQRFIVRSAKLAELYDLLWRTGLLINVDGAMAMVQVYPEAGHIDMQLRGTNLAYLLERLKTEITEVQEVKDDSGFLVSLTGQSNKWVMLEQLQSKKGKHIASTTGEILELAPFRPLLSSKNLNRDDDDYKAPGLKELSDRESGLQLLIPTPPPNPLEGLKLLVKKELINEGIGAAITCLETHLHTESTPATDLIVISSQFQEFSRSVAKGLHSFDEHYLLSNRISNQIVALLTTIQEADLK